MSARISLRGRLMLIRVDTLRKVHKVGFLVELAHLTKTHTTLGGFKLKPYPHTDVF